jgi:hypothetical protein
MKRPSLFAPAHHVHIVTYGCPNFRPASNPASDPTSVIPLPLASFLYLFSAAVMSAPVNISTLPPSETTSLGGFVARAKELFEASQEAAKALAECEKKLPLVIVHLVICRTANFNLIT